MCDERDDATREAKREAVGILKALLKVQSGSEYYAWHDAVDAAIAYCAEAMKEGGE